MFVRTSLWVPGPLGTLLLLLPVSAPEAAGPGVHILESTSALAVLAESDLNWQEVESNPETPSYLHLGAIAPDFQWIADSLNFGHSRQLWLAVLESAELSGDPLKMAFALGGLSHQATDSSWESWVTPALMGSAPLGMFEIFHQGGGTKGDAESITEGYGDIIAGDWHEVVDLLFDFWLESPEAKQKAIIILQWYCEAGNTFLMGNVPCENVVDEITEKLALAEEYLGFMTREQAHQFASTLIEQPLEDLADLVGGGQLAAFLGDAVEPGLWTDRDLERFKAGPLVDHSFWDQYKDIDHLGPAWSAWMVQTRTGSGFPGYEPNALKSGNIASVMAFLPEKYSVEPWFIVNGLDWFNSQNQSEYSLGSSNVGELWHARIAYFVAKAVSTKLTVVVKKDLPGLDSQLDEQIASASQDINIEPMDYPANGENSISVDFPVDISGALGLYLEVYVGDSSLPAFTTNWDSLWQIQELDMDRHVYTNTFGTYGTFPNSLPVLPVPQDASPSLKVKVRRGPIGNGISNAGVIISQGDGTAVAQTAAGSGGAAFFDALQPQVSYTVSVLVPENKFAQPPTQNLVLAPGSQPWVVFEVDPLVRFDQMPLAWNPKSCFDVQWNAEDFHGFVKVWNVEVLSMDGGVLWTVDKPLDGTAMICKSGDPVHGSVVQVSAWAKYVTGKEGLVGFGTPVLIDRLDPELNSITWEVTDMLPCVEEAPYAPQASLVLNVTDDSPVVLALVCNNVPGDTSFKTVPEVDSQYIADVPASYCAGPGNLLQVSMTDAAGNSRKLSVADNRPIWNTSHECPNTEPDPDVTEPDTDATIQPDTQDQDLAPQDGTVAGDSSPEPDADPAGDSSEDLVDASDSGPSGSSTGGCEASNRPAAAWLLLVMAGISLVGFRRRTPPIIRTHRWS